jgi:hypothetical protein
MARINYKVDKELALQGFLRVAVVAKALNVAPKTVNAWTKYPVSKIGGVKYLTWHDIISDKPTERQTYSLSDVANEVYTKVLLADPEKASTEVPQVITKTNDALAKAKALLQKLPELPSSIMATAIPEAIIPVELTDEILTVKYPEDGLLTVHPDYTHLLRKRK